MWISPLAHAETDRTQEKARILNVCIQPFQFENLQNVSSLFVFVYKSSFPIMVVGVDA